MNLRRFLAVTLAAVFWLPAAVWAGEWGYEGQTGVYPPDEWGHVAPACDGSRQSPIDIVTAEVQPVDHVGLRIHYKPDTVSVLNNGHAVTAYPDDRYIEVEGADGTWERYRLVQFHFHTLSEHTVDGRHFDMEMHLVHANDAYLAGQPGGKLSVIGVFIRKGRENKALRDIFDDLPEAVHHEAGEGEMLTARVPVDFDKLLPRKSAVFAYPGSLTTPGCDEIVSWFVFERPIQMSVAQIEAYRELYRDPETGERYDTNRPTQPLNGRVVSYGPLD
ncbi:carbonic anhydrase family protein [Dissulfurirhabdus thermomarina]|uniref:Carbonic anhydrase n=1 Tax=Dissulfurirhabdus thermomarina TaxID=1765737 RepID=A0A6N9TKU0_DISTH|nr:carbonic anhydrase family protein [Dissulfurirhabdus thermomarina]NDY41892.1 carbonic anhydrase family protein [Dissulfurirhabdus thermomarina]NMX23708.1 carbonic anhydrase family protein [Dissulfurirhabdus thermomarina]